MKCDTIRYVVWKRCVIDGEVNKIVIDVMECSMYTPKGNVRSLPIQWLDEMNKQYGNDPDYKIEVYFLYPTAN